MQTLITADEIKAILADHAKWMADNTTGKQADLRRANLSGAYLHGADLRRANLSGANLHAAYLRGADLREANLRGADLFGANLHRADLRGADLHEADLYGADLSGAILLRADLRWADLSGADLSGADLRWADLRWADLCVANLYGADLRQTCLDPDNMPSGADDSFKRVRGYVIGYRTRKAGHIDQYRDGRYYSADVFSTDDTECHPGLYLWPTLALAKSWSPNEELIKVRTRPTEVHKAGSKWRCRWFEVIGEAICKH